MTKNNVDVEPVAIVLAAGAATRFGGGKQIAPVDGVPMLARVCTAVGAAWNGRRIAVLGDRADEVAEVVPLDWEVVRCAEWERGPGASLRAGLAAAPDAQAALVVLGDLPWLDPVAVERVAAAGRSGVAAARATDGGRPGHPVWIGSALIDAARAAPDEGLRSLLAAAPTEPVTCDGLGVCDDVDRTADLPH
ncbi:MAG: nucleotidyltransferase family protein [Baekduia sp.]